jgi:hypothetical protein
MLLAGAGVLLLSGAGTCYFQWEWKTVANNGTQIPGAAPGITFNSYGQPSVNSQGLVVFRGRSAGSQQPVRGVYQKNLMIAGAPIEAIATVGGEVPQPNNTVYNGALASFNEFPAFPRIDAESATVVTRGQSQPVWTYLLPDGTETRVGTSGVYANPSGTLATGASLLGDVRDATTNAVVFPQFQVPGAPEGTGFDQFPGAPAVTGGSIIAFKGNFQEGGISQTGVFYRDILADAGQAPLQLVARSGDPIPNGGGAVFGSTAPPSAANGYLAFVGSDNEDAPTAGGVYRAALQPGAPLETLVAIGDPVPGEPAGPEATFTKFGEGLSVSSAGRHVAFWGAWGSETRPLTLICPTDGNQDLIAYCNQQYPNGYEVTVPVHQGIFVYDTTTRSLVRVVATGSEGFDDFVYWVYSGSPPGTGGGDEGGTEDREPPRWRSSAFAAVCGSTDVLSNVAFKAKRNGVDGIYRRFAQPNSVSALTLVVEVGELATMLDPEAPTGALVTAVGIERDGFRHGWLAINASMLEQGASEEETVGWGGVYVTQVPMNVAMPMMPMP